MRDWILGLKKAALEHGDGVSDSVWQGALSESGRAAPAELADLYKELDGATFASGVTLFPVRPRGDFPGLVEQSKTGGVGLPLAGTWRIGRRGEDELAVIPAAHVQEIQGDRPEWVGRLGGTGWAYVLRKPNGTVRWYPSLERLLTTLIPPAETEEFGDRTFARALSLVEGALTQASTEASAAALKVFSEAALSGAEDEEGEAEVVTAEVTKPSPPKRAPKKPAPKKKPSPPKAKAAAKPAKKATAKRTKKAAKKSAPKKPAKKSSARRAAKPTKAARKAARKAPPKRATKKGARRGKKR